MQELGQSPATWDYPRASTHLSSCHLSNASQQVRSPHTLWFTHPCISSPSSCPPTRDQWRWRGAVGTFHSLTSCFMEKTGKRRGGPPANGTMAPSYSTSAFSGPTWLLSEAGLHWALEPSLCTDWAPWTLPSPLVLPTHMQTCGFSQSNSK